MNDVLTRDGNGRGFDSRQIHQFKSIMELTKYQKSYLTEYMWHVHNDEHVPSMPSPGSGENSCWLQIDKEDGRVFEDAKKLLGYKVKDIENVKVLIVASRATSTSCTKHV